MNNILNVLSLDGKLTRNELAAIIGVSPNAIKQHLAELKRSGDITRLGSTKKGYWKVNRNYKKRR